MLGVGVTLPSGFFVLPTLACPPCPHGLPQPPRPLPLRVGDGGLAEASLDALGDVIPLPYA